ncbi:BTB/POZ and MATH domain-containing protein 3-like [Bidens hawaiensis]|uniref:BTB/POZ and MATH domain-containing protein 3-like n=1 Tax=Bidens hawaiensis TaxID=980011 RepID=UPI00404B42AF
MDSITSGISSASHEFTIRGFSLTKGMGGGNSIGSFTFKAGGHDWVISFYPEGSSPCSGSGRYRIRTTCYVSVLLALASDASDVKVLFELTLLDQTGKGNHAVFGRFDENPSPRTLNGRGSMTGYERLMTWIDLESSDYLKDDCLTMHFRIGVVREGSKGFTFSIHPSDMAQNLNSLLETETGCDIVLRVGDQTFKAHKSILAARSPVFRARFFGNDPDIAGDQVELKDVEPSIFKAMLLFIYSEALPESMSTNMIQHLFAAAKRFDVHRLKQLCEAKLCEQVNVDTVETALSFADKHGCSQLKSVCLEFAHKTGRLDEKRSA